MLRGTQDRDARTEREEQRVMPDEKTTASEQEQPSEQTHARAQPSSGQVSRAEGERRPVGSPIEPRIPSWRHRRQDDRELSKLITAWVEHTWDEDKVKPAFIENEFQGRLQSYRAWARGWRVAQISVWVLIALLGLLISVFAGFKVGHGFTIVAGALIATLTTLTNATHPAQQADGYLTARLGLRDEGWALLNHTGSYAKLQGDAAFAHFADAIHSIVVKKRSMTTLDLLSAS
jgi:hypothetical protein